MHAAAASPFLPAAGAGIAGVAANAPAPAHALAEVLRAYERAVLGLPRWVDASWWQALGLRGTPAASSTATGAALAAALGLGLAPATAFSTPAHRMSVLPPALLCRVLRARALLRRRAVLRHCVEGELRARLAAWAHPAVFEAVLCEAGDAPDGSAAGLPLDVLSTPTTDTGQDALAWEGLSLFEADGIWTEPALWQLVRMGFPCQQAPAPCGGSRDGSHWVLQRLARFVPEAPWLCG